MYKLKIVELPKPLNIKTQINFPEVVLGKMQEKTIIPKTTFQEVLPDKNYDGLSKVNVEAVTNEIDENIKSENIKKDISILGVQGNVEELNGTKIEITKNGTYTPEEPYNAFTEVEANVESDPSEYFGDSIKSGDTSTSGLNQIIKKCPNTITINGMYGNYLFYNCFSLQEIPLLDTSNIINLSNAFSGCKSITTIPLLNTSKVTNMSYLFYNCEKLESIPLLNTSKVTNMERTFYNCRALLTIPLLDTSKVVNMSNMFNTAVHLTSIPQIDTSRVNNMSAMFSQAQHLETIPKLNAALVTNVNNIFNYCIDLKNFGGLQNIGQAYSTTASANYSSYKFGLSDCENLTHDSLMNVINNLYDIATKGVKTQQLVLGSTNISKLSAEEVAIGTSKGWSIS